MVAENENFLHLEFSLLEKVLASSQLNIHSEIEAFNAASAWLKTNAEVRSTFAKQLLLKIRFTLLSEHAIAHCLGEKSPFAENSDCVNLMEEVLSCKPNFRLPRYCEQSAFDVFSCGGYDLRERKNVASARQIRGNDPGEAEDLADMTFERRQHQAVISRGEVYVFCGCDMKHRTVSPVEKYSTRTNAWSKVADMVDSRDLINACAFADSIYVTGGFRGFFTINSCLRFDTRDNSWREVAGMRGERHSAASAVFNEQVVVSGGVDDNDSRLNTVESYDVFADTWTPMPNMVYKKCGHSLIAVRNKLYSIHFHDDSEVFEKLSQTFVALKPQLDFYYHSRAVSLGNEIVIIEDNKPCVTLYDFDKNTWSVKSNRVLWKAQSFACVKFPNMKLIL